MPPHSKEVALTEIEVDLMTAFVKHKVFNDRHCAIVLMQLADKLEGKYAQTLEQNTDR